MKTLWIFGLALALIFIAPLAQASPAAVQPEPVQVTVAAGPVAAPHPSGPTAPPSGPRDPDRRPQSGPEDSRHAWADHDGNSPAPGQDASQDIAPAAEVDDNPVSDSSCISTTAAPAQPAQAAHYSMDDLANAAASLDESY